MVTAATAARHFSRPDTVRRDVEIIIELFIMF